MKKLFLTLSLLILPLIVSGCSANVIGKYDDYNEIFEGTIDLDLEGGAYIEAVSHPSGITCKGDGELTYIPLQGFLLGMCRGQRGVANLTCDDGREITGDWVCRKWVRIEGTATSNENEKISFYIEKSDKKHALQKEKYITDVKNKPPLPPSSTDNNRFIYPKDDIIKELF